MEKPGMKQLNLFEKASNDLQHNSIKYSSSISLSTEIIKCPRCLSQGKLWVRPRPDTIHAAEIKCACCNLHVQWVSKPEYRFLQVSNSSNIGEF
jgi:hypothetical protein